MKYISAYKDKIGCANEAEVFSYLISNLKPTIKSWDYFVNWAKVLGNYSKIDKELELLNSLVKAENIEEKAKQLLTANPSIIKVIPILIALREGKANLLIDYKGGFKYEEYAFTKTLAVELAVKTMKETGLLKMLEDGIISSVPNYVIGVEAGLDSNARKNRSGTSMENIVEFFVAELCVKNDWKWMAQATQGKIAKEWGKHITVEKSIRQIDFAILANDKLFLIEANFYGGGGSKLKSTAGEYKTDFRRWKNDGHEFIWVTDGEGWVSTHKPLRETFDETDTILTLDMLEKGLLEEVISA